MPNIKSAKKELKKNLKRKTANQKANSVLKDLLKNSLKQIVAGDKKVKENLNLLIKTLDKAAKRGLIKKNTASRQKARLMKKINALK